MKKLKNIYIEITRACNLKCPFCPSRNYSLNNFMTMDEFKSIIDQIKDYTDGIYLHVLGEPLLHPDVFNFIEYAAKYLKVSMTTNGRLIKKYHKELATSKLYILNVSLQSLISESNENISEYFKYLNLLIKERTSNLPIHLRMWNDKDKEDVKELNNLIYHYIDELNIDSLKNVNLSVADEFTWPDMGLGINNIKSKCLGARRQLAINVFGDVSICCLDYLGHTNIGNIFTESFKKIIESETFKNVLKGWENYNPYFELCKRCTYRNRFKKENKNESKSS